MQLYVHVTDGAVDNEPGPLPSNWRHVSGMEGLSEEELAQLGWYTVGTRPAHNTDWQLEPVAEVQVSGNPGAHIVDVTWSAPPRSWQSVRDLCHARIEELREEMIRRGATVDVGNGPFQVQTRNEIDARNISGLATLATSALIGSQPFEAPFRDMDDVTHTLSAQQVLSLHAQVTLWVQAHYQASWNHKAALAALGEDAEALAGYDINTGWPE